MSCFKEIIEEIPIPQYEKEGWGMKLVRPVKNRSILPMVLILHDFLNQEQGALAKRFSETLAVQGIASIRMTAAGSECRCSVHTAQDARDTLYRQIDYGERILDYVREQKYIDSGKIGFIGVGEMAPAGSLFCGKHADEIAALCLVSPSGRVMSDPGATEEVFQYAGLYQNKALLISEETDECISIEHIERFFDIYKHSEIRTVSNSEKKSNQKEHDAICRLIKAFFAKDLQYQHLFSPLKAGSLILKNRIVAAPITKYGHFPSDADEIEFIASRARGGAGLVILGSVAVDDENSLIYYEGSSLNGPKQMIYQEELSMLHQYGAKVSVQLLHCGMFADLRNRKADPVGPYTFVRSGEYEGLEGIENNQIMDGRTVQGLTREDMDRIVEQYVHSALTAKRMGFDMVMLHFAHGWLMAEFLSPFFNKRTDEYGGNFENRIRFPMEIVKKVREAVGKDYPLDMRIAADEYVEGGLKPDEVIEFIRRVEDQLDMVHISSGLDKFAEQTTYIESPSLYPHQINVPFAEMAKKVLHIPVVTVGGINMPDEAEEILCEGKADAIAMARAFIADPQWPDKARTGNTGDITPCIRCVSCYGVATEGIGLGCAVNPCYARELRLQTERDLWNREKTAGLIRRKNVVVIGGGPAGMQAAVTASECGNHVILLEKSNRLGGLLNISNTDDLKIDMRQYKEHLIYKVLHAEIDLRLNCEATPEMVRKLRPDKIIVAVGSEPKKIPIPGIDQQHVLDVVTAHEKEELSGENVVVIGAGPSGCECALSLAGQGKKVTLVEFTDKPAAAGNLIYQWALRKLFREEKNLTCMYNAAVMEIREDNVLVKHRNGAEQVIPADVVVYSVGMKARRELAESFMGITYDVRIIGDCASPRRINEAAQEGYFAGLW
ncbi:MAG: FAD-dependent oxidoreductase [Blautia sp.]|nr:FAD-dependent oxidoreductase [Blautia sp.]